LAQTSIEKVFTDVWQFREEIVYPRLFGSITPEISLIPAEFFADDKQVIQPPPLWLHYGVLPSPPDSIRNCWAYVSSGLSNPTPDQCENPNPAEPSGIGFELVMFSAAPSSWAPRMIQWVMANQLMAAAGITSFDLMEIFDRIHLPAALQPPAPSNIKHLFVLPAPADIQQFELPTGRVELLLLVGVTEAEMRFARAQGGDGLLELLQHHGISRLTDTSRASVI
jgi:hypothetical protein